MLRVGSNDFESKKYNAQTHTTHNSSDNAQTTVCHRLGFRYSATNNFYSIVISTLSTTHTTTILDEPPHHNGWNKESDEAMDGGNQRQKRVITSINDWIRYVFFGSFSLFCFTNVFYIVKTISTHMTTIQDEPPHHNDWHHQTRRETRQCQWMEGTGGKRFGG